MLKNIAGDKAKSSLTKIDEDMVQPNAVDLRLDRVFKVHMHTPFILDEDKKVHRDVDEISPDANGYYHFKEGSYYQIRMEGEVDVAVGEAGWVVPRSTLQRNGLHVKTCLYDSGYNGPMTQGLKCDGKAMIKRGTRVAQYICADAEALKEYDGDYGNDKDGEKKSMEKEIYGD